MTPETLFYFRKNQYGNELVYLATHQSSEMTLAAQHVRRLTGRSTLTPSDMDALAGLGFAFVEVLAPREGAGERTMKFAGGQ